MPVTNSPKLGFPIPGATSSDSRLDDIVAVKTALLSVDDVTGSLQSELNNKQDTLISGNNIRTVNGNSLLGDTNILLDTFSHGLGNDVSNLATDPNSLQLLQDLGGSVYNARALKIGEGYTPGTYDGVVLHDSLGSPTDLVGRISISSTLNYGKIFGFNFAGTGFSRGVNHEIGEILYLPPDFAGGAGTVSPEFYITPYASGNLAIGTNALIANTTGSNNTAIGYNALKLSSSGFNNVAIGNITLLNNNGSNNVGIGYASLSSNTTGNGNIAIGNNSLSFNTNGFSNVGIGSNALGNNTTGNSNIAIGVSTLYYNTYGVSNIAIGASALQNNTTGSAGIAIGTNALYSNTTGSSNTAVGYYSLKNNTEGSYNVAVGYNALTSNTTGSNNTAVGYNSLQYNTTGIQNTAIGTYALLSNTIGTDNVGIGYYALLSNVTGVNNVAVGISALQANVSGVGNTSIGYAALMNSVENYNTAVGNAALYANTTGVNNTAIGGDALYSNISGNNNVASGYKALTSNTTGYANTAIGFNSLYTNTTGVNNVAVGISALVNNTTGTDNTAVGKYALRQTVDSFNFETFTNCTGLGANASVSGSNQVQLGDSATTTYVYGTVQNRSDLRDKAQVRDTVLGLDFVNSLRPVDYKWDMREDYKTIESYTEEVPAVLNEEGEVIEPARTVEKTRTVKAEKDGTKVRNRYHHGLIAQEVKTVIEATGLDFGGFQDHMLAGGCDVQTIGYDELIAPLIKAVQELTARVKLLEQR